MPLQPVTFGARFNRSDPLAAGLIGAWLCNEGSGSTVYDATDRGSGDGTVTITAGTVTTASGLYGRGLYSTGSPFQSRAITMPTGSTTVKLGTADIPDFTLGWVATRDSSDANAWSVFTGFSVGFGNKMVLEQSTTAVMLTFDAGPVSISYTQPTSVPVVMSLTKQGTTISLYADGVPVGTASVGASSVTGSPASAPYWYGFNHSSMWWWGVFAWSRPLTAGENRIFRLDPYRMFRGKPVSARFAPAAAPPASGYRYIGSWGAGF